MKIDYKYKEQQNLIRELNKATKSYDEGHPTMSDSEWDDLYFTLQKEEEETGIVLEDSPTSSISFDIVSELNKITHEHPMLSLPKTKSLEEVKSFIGNNSYIFMAKMDGLTCSLTYENGELVRAETRGDGEIGEDILHNAKVIKSIPNTIDFKDRLVVDGEIICTYKDFEEFVGEYKNPRNFAAGSIRLLDSEECSKRKLTFVVWDVIEGLEDDLLYNRLNYVWELGFETVPFIFYSMQTIEEEFNSIKDICTDLGYPIDGIVVKYQSKKLRDSLPGTAHHAGGALAFKFTDELFKTTLNRIEWTMGRTGVLTPVAVFDPIEIDGSTVERASLHNLTVMEDTLGAAPTNADTVYVYKANQIIPQIAKTEPGNGECIEIPAVCPICGEPVIRKQSDVSDTEVLICNNANCDGLLVNKIDHYCGKKGLDIKGLSKKTIEKLIDWGWIESISDIYLLWMKRDKWIKKSGFGPASVDKILEAIRVSSDTTLDKFICAIGIPLIGTTASKEICKYIKDYEEFRSKVDSRWGFDPCDNLGDSKLSYIYNFDYTQADFIYENYLDIAVPDDEEEQTEQPQSLSGKTIVITGKLITYKNRDELVADIESHGGKVSSSVSSKTNILVNNDINSTSSKNKKAKELNIPIITEEDLVEKYFK